MDAAHRTLLVALEPAVHAVRVKAVLAVERPDLDVHLEVGQADRALLAVLLLVGHVLRQVLGRGRVLLDHLLPQSRVQATHPDQLQQHVQPGLDAPPVVAHQQAVAGQRIGQRQFQLTSVVFVTRVRPEAAMQFPLQLLAT